MKKEVRAIASLQIERLEKAMCEQRRWHADAFRMYFVEHPLLRHLSQRLVWGTYGDGKLTQSFRVAADGSLADANDAPIAIDDGAVVGMAHPLHLGEKALVCWTQVFADYEILQPFMQLARAVHAITDEERTARKVTRFEGLEVKGGALVGLTSRGWSRGSIEDNGIYYELHHALGTMGFSPGMGIGMHGGDQQDQKLGPITLAAQSDVDALRFSEMIRGLEGLRKAR